MTVIILLLLWF